MVRNKEAVVRRGARVRQGGDEARPRAASDPTTPGEAHIPAVDAALRGSRTSSSRDRRQRARDARDTDAGRRRRAAADALAYLRDRGVPRDMKYPAARRLRTSTGSTRWRRRHHVTRSRMRNNSFFLLP